MESVCHAPVDEKGVRLTMEVFELFASRRRAATALEVSIELRTPRPVTVALLEFLAGKGYLSYSTVTGQYRPTAKVRSLTKWIAN